MPTRQTRVTRIIVNGRKIFIYTPYDADFVSELKSAIPHGSRRWDPEARCWEASVQFLDNVRAIIRNHFGEPIVRNGPASGSGPRTAEEGARQNAEREDARERARQAREEQAREERARERERQQREQDRIREDFRRRFGFGFDEDTDDPWGFSARSSGRSNGRSGSSGGRGGVPPTSTGLTWADKMFMELPAEVHRGVYLALVKALHPDRVGEAIGTEAMKTLNKAHDTHGKDK